MAEKGDVRVNAWCWTVTRAQPHSAMMIRSAIPATIGTRPRDRALAFLSLFFAPGVAQAILLTVVPLQALNLLGNARAVTLVYVATGLVAVIGRLSIPYLVTLIRRRFVFTLGTLSLAIRKKRPACLR